VQLSHPQSATNSSLANAGGFSRAQLAPRSPPVRRITARAPGSPRATNRPSYVHFACRSLEPFQKCDFRLPPLRTGEITGGEP